MAKKPNKPADVFDDLASEIPEKPETPKKKKSNPSLTPSPELQAAVERFAASSEGLKILKGQEKGDKADVYKLGFEEFVDIWHAQGNKPDNPIISTPLASCLLQVRSNVTVKVPQDSTVDQELKDRGLSAAKAKRWAGLVTTNTVLTVKPFNDLRNGTAKEKAAADKLMLLIKNHLTPEELQIVIDKEKVVEVNDEELFSRLAAESKNPAEMLMVLEVLSPQIALSSVHHQDALPVILDRIKEAKKAKD